MTLSDGFKLAPSRAGRGAPPREVDAHSVFGRGKIRYHMTAIKHPGELRVSGWSKHRRAITGASGAAAIVRVQASCGKDGWCAMFWRTWGIIEPMATPSLTGPDFSKNDGLLPAIAQDAQNGQVLMLAWMNAEAYAETIRTGRAVYYSRSRGKLWRKGEESGHVQTVRAIYIDCDADTILLKVDQLGAACHEGYRSCFFREVTAEGVKVVNERMVEPEKVYRTK